MTVLIIPDELVPPKQKHEVIVGDGKQMRDSEDTSRGLGTVPYVCTYGSLRYGTGTCIAKTKSVPMPGLEPGYPA
jgi:hypothetical protein